MISEIVGGKSAYPFLNAVYEIKDIVRNLDLEGLIKENDISEALFSDLVNTGLLIGTSEGYYISSLGKKITLLLRAINGESDVSHLFNQLTYLYPEIRPYELITENITDYFIDSIIRDSSFIRVYICSPWIRLHEIHLQKFSAAILKASQMYKNLEILVITKPKEGYRNWKASIETFKVLLDLGAVVMTHAKLHTKLYISEPGPYGGGHYSILGSENLTGRGNIELAIKIQNDNDILRKLNLYFYEIWQECQILQEV